MHIHTIITHVGREKELQEKRRRQAEKRHGKPSSSSSSLAPAPDDIFGAKPRVPSGSSSSSSSYAGAQPSGVSSRDVDLFANGNACCVGVWLCVIFLF